MTPFEIKLAKRINEEITRLRGGLENMAAVPTFEKYHYFVGQINALKMVVEFYFDEVNEDLNKEK